MMEGEKERRLAVTAGEGEHDARRGNMMEGEKERRREGERERREGETARDSARRCIETLLKD